MYRMALVSCYWLLSTVYLFSVRAFFRSSLQAFLFIGPRQARPTLTHQKVQDQDRQVVLCLPRPLPDSPGWLAVSMSMTKVPLFPLYCSNKILLSVTQYLEILTVCLLLQLLLVIKCWVSVIFEVISR